MRYAATRIFKDHIGTEIQISFPPQRIISTVPSQTELLFDLGLDEEIIAVTKFCIHPKEKVKSKIRIGGTKSLNLEKIKSLSPDLIIANKEENEEQQIKELMKDFPVYISDIKTLEDAYEMMQQVGEIVNRKTQSENLVNQIKSSVLSLKSSVPTEKCTAAYLIWNNPIMTIGCDTFIHSMLEAAGFENVFANQSRYPEISINEIQKLNPEFLFLSSEPFPFAQKHIDEWQPLLPYTKIILVDGEMFSWYGSRLLKSAAYFRG